LIEDNPGDARLVKEMLSEVKNVFFDLEWTDDLAKSLKRLAAGGIEVVLLDLNLPDSQGFNTIVRIQSEAPQVPTVIMTGLDDETLAIRAVRQGAQDYLVKGEIKGWQLARAIRYAIARRLGESKRLSIEELMTFDGKEGRAAYIAFKGRVYDVSGNRLWKNGLHGAKHIAGTDLTAAFAGAPHGESTLAKVPIVGDLVQEKTRTQKFLDQIQRLHPHPISAHFTIAYSVIVSIFSVLFLLTNDGTLERMAFYLLLLGFAATPISAASGLLSWKINYGGKATRLLVTKMILTAAFVTVIAACLIWRLAAPEILISRSMAAYLYLLLVISLMPLAAALGYCGGKIVFG
jgi:predicted heme/steroid binding protein/CheY-like chemotaxis protein/uncharacterized membrane protein